MRTGTKLHATFAVAAWCVVYAIEHSGNSPSIPEIAQHFGVWNSTIERTLDRMYKHGIAERIDGKLVICGGEYAPPRWYVENVSPTLSSTDQTDNARRNKRIESVAV